MWQARVARAERDRAQLEATKANQVADFLARVFEVSNPGEALGATITARELLDQGAERIETELANQPEVQAKMMRVIGSVYQNLGLHDEGKRLVEQALIRQRALFKEDHPDLAETLHQFGWASYYESGDGSRENFYRFIQLFREAWTMRQRLYGNDHPAVARSQASLSWMLVAVDSFEVAERYLREALTTQRKHLGRHPEVAETLFGSVN